MYTPYIILVEDNTKLRKKIKAILKSAYPSLEIGEASGEKEVLNKIKTKQPEFMIIDISLSSGDGLQLTQKVKKNYPDITIAINTDYDSPEYHAAAMNFGADYFLSKK